MKRIIVLTVQIISFLLGSTALAAPAAEDDQVLKAMVDEMNRSKKELHIDPQPVPYFVAYSIKENDELEVSSCLGSQASMERCRDRMVVPIVRIGSFKLDSSYPLSTRVDHADRVTIDDDYRAIRRTLWLNSDYAYKNAVTNFEWKKAYLAAHSVPDRLDDMTSEPPVRSINEITRVSDEDRKWSGIVEQLSALFKQYPALQKSKVRFVARHINWWHVNSEGTAVRDCQSKFSVIAWATAQAQDGMPISDYDCVSAPEESELPGFDALKDMCERLAQRVTALRDAHKGGEYCGPVLFKGQAAAEFFSQVMAPNFGFAEDYLGSEDWRNPFKDGIGRRILPNFISVTDDPQAKEFGGVALAGGYRFDDEGVPAQKVDLVENGILKGFCQSRIPTRHSDKSNGHSLGGHGVYNIIQITSSKTSSEEELKQKLIELAKEAGLDHYLVIERLADEIHLYEYPSATQGLETRPYATPSYSRQPSSPVVAYRVYIKDGRKELVRGLEFRYVSLRAFRDIQATGKDAAAYLIEPEDCAARHLITPSYVIGELELTPVKAEYSAPPILPCPLASQPPK